jgi:cytochrome P450
VRDFAYLDMRGETDVYAHFRKLHAEPDIIYSPYYGGHWIVSRDEDMEYILTHPEDFSSKHSSLPVNPAVVTLLENDGAIHSDFRRLVQPFFAPKKIGELEQVARKLSIELIEGFYPRGECDFTRDFAQHMPIAIAMSLIGLPPEDRPYLLSIAEDLVRSGDPQKQESAFQRVFDYFGTKIIPARKAQPGNDIVSAVLRGKVDGGREPTEQELLLLCVLLIAGGLDTVVSMMGFTALFLAQNPGHRQQLIDDPSLIPAAVEELMRRHHIANISRVVTRDLEYKGVQFKQGDLVLVPLSAAGIDERRYKDALEVDFQRGEKRHLVFGRGPHQCIGQFLARAELRVFVSEWLKRIPHFEVKPGERPIARPGKANGFSYLPLTWKVSRH